MRSPPGRTKYIWVSILIAFLGLWIFVAGPKILANAQNYKTPDELDARVEKFLHDNRSNWHDWNVPYQDGKLLHDLIVKNNFKLALEIGTSTAHNVKTPYGDIKQFLDYVTSLPSYQTTIEGSGSSGISISYKKCT